MDLATVKKHVETGIIKNLAQFERDVYLIFFNALMYNLKSHSIYPMALEMYRDTYGIIEVG